MPARTKAEARLARLQYGGEHCLMAAQATVADLETQVTAKDDELDIMTADFEATCEALSRAQAHVEELTSRISSRAEKNARLREERDALAGARERRLRRRLVMSRRASRELLIE